MSTTRLDEICIFLFCNIFTNKLSALGISNLPTAIQTVRAACKDKAKKKEGKIIYAAGIFNSLVVVSGLTGRWPYLIKTNAVANILNGVKESISARRKAESVSEEEVNHEKPKKRSILSNAIKNMFFPSRKGSNEDPSDSTKEGGDAADDANDSSTSTTTDTVASTKTEEVKPATSSGTSSGKNWFFSSRKSSKDPTTKPAADAKKAKYDESKRKKTLVKAQALLAGKRESSLDDIIWGAFQISLVFYDMTRWQAVGRAWMIYLLHSLEETAFSVKLTRKQKTRKIVCLTITAYYSGSKVFKQ